MMRGRLLAYSFLTTAAITLSAPAIGAPWVRSYVVTSYEPAWYFGGSISFHKANTANPGSDCPKGTNPDFDYSQIFKTPWRSAADIEAINHPPKADILTIAFLQQRALSYRGFRKDIETFINPFAASDPGMQEVTGKIAEGFNLDGNPTTGGFTSPSGERGVDNAFYRVFGCVGSFRGDPYHAALSMRANDKMTEGLYTMVIRVIGNEDPLNDDEATVEIGYSPDHMAIGANNVILSDYSFRIARNSQYSKVRAIVKNGIVETAPVSELHAPRFSWFPNHYGDADFHQGQLRLVPDGSGGVFGLIGGYRDWRDIYVEDNFTQFGGVQEQREHQNSIAMYYALKRNADGLRDPKTGQLMGISTAYRFVGKSAFVVDSHVSLNAAAPATSPIQRRQFTAMRDVFYRALDSKQIQSVPKGSEEAAVSHLYQRPDGTWMFVADSVIAARESKELQTFNSDQKLNENVH